MEKKGDPLSILPTEILQHIISMLSLKEAVQMSSLSTSLRSLMNPSRLNLSSKQGLNHAIQSLSESGAGFRTLILHLDAAPLAVCTKGVNGELRLDFSLHRLISATFGFSVKQTTRRSAFSLIKSLHLRSLPRLAGDAVIRDLCSRVEDLKIEKCGGLQSIEIESSESLKNLDISDCPNVAKIVLASAPNLSSFSYKGAFPLLELLNVPNLVRVSLDFGDDLGGKELDCEDCVSMLSSLKDIESLQLSACLIEALCCCGVIFSHLDFQFSRLKDLRMLCSRVSSKTRDSFACFLHITPSLEELELRVRNEHGGVVVEYPSHYQNWHEPHLWKDYATVKAEACRLKHIKRIRVMGFTMETDELLWMDLLLHNGINLKEMIVDDCWRVARVPFTQLGYIKLQYVFIPCPHIDSYFVLIADS